MSIVGEVLFPYQVEAAERIVRDRRLLLADQPGLGKTLEVFGGLELAGLFDKPSTILVVSPVVNAQTTWRDTVERFVRQFHDVVLVDVSKGSAVQKQKALLSGVRESIDTNFPTIFLANHNALDWVKDAHRVKGLGSVRFDAVVVDESHLVLPIRDSRKLTNFWKGLSRLVLQDGCLRVAVSGTPDRGKLWNRFGTWRFLHPDIVESSLFAWQEKHFVMKEQRVSKSRVVRVPSVLRNSRDWLGRDADWMLRRTKAEVLPSLPAKRYVDVEVELGERQRVKYFGEQLRSEERMRGDGDSTAEAMLFALRSRQVAICEWDDDWVPVVGGVSAKRDWLFEWLDERGFIEHDDMADNTAKVVVVSQFSKVLFWLKAELELVGVECAVLDGSASAGVRASIQNRFQDRTDSLRVVLLSGSMGVGINLDAADDLIMLDVPYDPDRVEQIEDRVHRASSNHKVTIWNVAALDTIDQVVLEQVSKRYRITRGLLDGSRGIEFARKVVAVIRKGSVDGDK